MYKWPTAWVSCYLGHPWGSTCRLPLPSNPPSFLLWLTLGRRARAVSFLLWVTGIRAECPPEHRWWRAGIPQAHWVNLRVDFERFPPQPICELLPNSTPFVFYEGGEIVGGKRIPWTTTKKKEESQRLVLVVREMGTRTVGRNLCSIRTGLLETLSKVSICEGRQKFFSWGGRSGKK